MNRKMLVTNALPYANGPLHLGHMLGCIQADIWVRFQKLQGHECTYLCADDTHGTPIMLKAKELGITPEHMIEMIQKDHEADFKDFLIDFDTYHSTHSKENQVLVEEIYQKLLKAGHIQTKEILQAYDEKAQLFLPDRYVKGECPRCHAPDQYGDNCEACGATYNTMDLIEPRSVISGDKPVQKSSLHYFFALEHFEDFLKNWLATKPVSNQIIHKLQEWLKEGLKSWDISRDAPYFGFKIPGTDDKYFYVWMDAPIGYMATCQKFCSEHPKASRFEDYFSKDSTIELYHFIGKDIIYFHTLFWPAVLEGSEFRLPHQIFVNGFLTINGQKMSKSRHTFITARDYLTFFDAEFLRYYFAAKLGHECVDIDFNFSDFVLRHNSDLVGKVINIASRCSRILENHFESQLSYDFSSSALLEHFNQQANLIVNHYEARDYHFAMRDIMTLADSVNQYLAETQPWSLVKQNQMDDAQKICTLGLNLFKQIIFFLKPVLPITCQKVEEWLDISEMNWSNYQENVLGKKIKKYTPLMTRIDEEKIKLLQSTLEKAPTQKEKVKLMESIKSTIEFSDFEKIDLRIGKIVEASYIEGAEKLLSLSVDIGEEKPRTIFAGIRSAYAPEDLIGKFTAVVANLAPRKMRFGISEGMVLAAGPGGKELWLLEPHSGADIGMRIK